MTLVWLWCLIAVWVYPLDSNLRASAPYVPAVKNILFLETNSPHILTPFPIPSSTASPGLSLTPSLGMAHPHSTVAFLLLFLGFSFFFCCVYLYLSLLLCHLPSSVAARSLGTGISGRGDVICPDFWLLCSCRETASFTEWPLDIHWTQGSWVNFLNLALTFCITATRTHFLLLMWRSTTVPQACPCSPCLCRPVPTTGNVFSEPFSTLPYYTKSQLTPGKHLRHTAYVFFPCSSQGKLFCLTHLVTEFILHPDRMCIHIHGCYWCRVLPCVLSFNFSQYFHFNFPTLEILWEVRIRSEDSHPGVPPAWERRVSVA